MTQERINEWTELHRAASESLRLLESQIADYGELASSCKDGKALGYAKSLRRQVTEYQQYLAGLSILISGVRDGVLDRLSDDLRTTNERLRGALDKVSTSLVESLRAKPAKPDDGRARIFYEASPTRQE